ncbi:UNVERIFIED_CONTAM: hypothetical protein HDU68_003709, partial [Siphonaria sp. JEL0065]
DLSDLLGTGPAKPVPVNPNYSLKKKAIAKDPNDPASILLAKHHDSDKDDDDENESIYDSEDQQESAKDSAIADQLSSFVSNLDSKHANKKRKIALAESTEAYTESEFNLNSRSQSTSGSAKLDFTDLVGSLSGDSTFTHLRKQLTELAPGTENSHPGKSKLRADGTEAAPLPTRIQDRIGRQAAYQSAKKEVEKWSGVIKRNRKAEQLDFTTFEETPSAIVSSAALVSQFKATTDMEQEIAQILKDSALDEKKQMELEDLEMNALSHEEMVAKRQELVKLRSLAFYAEQKAKKISKIKSKTYRKIHKKDALRKAVKDGSGLSLEELKDLDPDAAREKAEKLHVDRIKERMTLKHKSTGKWARKMMARGDRGDDDSRQALMDQLSKNQDLTRKIAGLESDEDSDALNSDSDDGDNMDGLETGARAKRRGAAALQDLEDQILEDQQQIGKAAPKKGIYAMKFMQRGLENQMKESKAMLEEARRALEAEDSDEVDSDGDVKPKTVKKEKKQAGGVGRMVFSSQDGDDVEEDDEEEEADVENSGRVSSTQFNMESQPIAISVDGTSAASLKVAKEKKTFSAKITDAKFGDEMETISLAPTKQSKKQQKLSVTQAPIVAPTHPSAKKVQQKAASEDGASNPWLATDTSFTKKSTKINVALADKAMEKMNKVKQLQKESETVEDMDFTLNLDGVRKLEVVKEQTQQPQKSAAQQQQQQQQSTTPPTLSKKEKKRLAAAAKAQEEFSESQEYGPIKPKPKPTISYDSDQDSDEEAVYNKIASNFIHTSDISTLTQRQLMQIAFANDNVAQEFQQEKEKIVAEDAPEVVDNTLPGWGSWAGNGAEPKTNLIAEVKKKANSIDATKRKDAKLAHVIINERRIRKAGKYLAQDLPFGFESREQYEQAIRMPLGVEWNTTASHARLTAPKVVTKMGTIINPLRLPGNGAPKEESNKKKPRGKISGAGSSSGGKKDMKKRK